MIFWAMVMLLGCWHLMEILLNKVSDSQSLLLAFQKIYPTMARTQSSRNKNLDAASRKKCKNADESSSRPWENLPHDLLLIILMQLGLIDFISFSGVCRSWRSFALLHRERAMASREPMTVYITPQAKRSCCLVELGGERIFKTMLPNFSGRLCVGVASGYLIMCGKKTHDFSLMNLITRHELHFPVLPSSVDFNFPSLRPILVFSHSGYMLVITFIYSKKILFCLNGSAACWEELSTDVGIVDLHALHRKMYVLDINGTLSEMKLKPKPTLMHLKTKNAPKAPFYYPPQLISLSEKLFLLDFLAPTLHFAFELDTENMEWVHRRKAAMEELTIFLSEMKCGAIVDHQNWSDQSKQLCTELCFIEPRKDHSRRFRSVLADYINGPMPSDGHQAAWYFPHDCHNVNRLDEE